MSSSRTAATCTGLRPGSQPVAKRVRLHEEDDQEGADDRAPVVAGAAGGEGQHDVDGDERHEHLGGDVGRVVAPQRAGQRPGCPR